MRDLGGMSDGWRVTSGEATVRMADIDPELEAGMTWRRNRTERAMRAGAGACAVAIALTAAASGGLRHASARYQDAAMLSSAQSWIMACLFALAGLLCGLVPG
jgi:hypothetical protein